MTLKKLLFSPLHDSCCALNANGVKDFFEWVICPYTDGNTNPCLWRYQNL